MRMPSSPPPLHRKFLLVDQQEYERYKAFREAPDYQNPEGGRDTARQRHIASLQESIVRSGKGPSDIESRKRNVGIKNIRNLNEKGSVVPATVSVAPDKTKKKDTVTEELAKYGTSARQLEDAKKILAHLEGLSKVTVDREGNVFSTAATGTQRDSLSEVLLALTAPKRNDREHRYLRAYPEVWKGLSDAGFDERHIYNTGALRSYRASNKRGVWADF